MCVSIAGQGRAEWDEMSTVSTAASAQEYGHLLCSQRRGRCRCGTGRRICVQRRATNVVVGVGAGWGFMYAYLSGRGSAAVGKR